MSVLKPSLDSVNLGVVTVIAFQVVIVALLVALIVSIYTDIKHAKQIRQEIHQTKHFEDCGTDHGHPPCEDTRCCPVSHRYL